MSDMNKAPLPPEVWVVCSQTEPGAMSSDYVADYRQAAMEHAAELAASPHEICSAFGPFRVARYVLAEGGFGPVDGNWQNTSLENWFPISAEELNRLRQKPTCQYGKDVGMPEYSCATECQLRATPAVTVNNQGKP